MNARVSHGRIVSTFALQYTQREEISCHSDREGSDLCQPKLCVNQAEED